MQSQMVRHTRGGVRAAALRMLAAAAMIGAVGGSAHAQAPVSNDAQAPSERPRRLLPPMFVEPNGPVDAVEYADGGQHTYDTETRWRYTCGSSVAALTGEDLERIAKDHHQKMAQAGQLVVIDSGGSDLRGPGFNIIFSINPSGAPAGYATSFAQAEAYLESKFTDPITVTINVSWANMGSGVIGATGSAYINGVSWTSSRAGLVSGMDSNDTIQSFLPTGSTIPVRFNATSATVTNVNTVDWTRANYRSTVGSLGAATDCNMQFNNTFTFDFDPTNGVGFNQTSLVDVIIHEVGHGMGFTSNADMSNPSNIQALDIFRFARVDRAGIGNTNPDTTAQFQTTAREVDFNNPSTDDANSDLISAEYRMSDGTPYQASHFFQQNANPPSALGIMQPAFADGVTFGPNYFKASDYNMFDAIGWDDSTASCTAPAITTQPSGLSRCEGVSATFTVAVTGSPAPTYQWQKNGSNIPGATGASYTIASPTTADSGNYTCALNNACGSVTTNIATLSVQTVPTVTTQPVGQSACAGDGVDLFCIGNGIPTPTLQWRKNGVNIPGATTFTLSLPDISPADAGNYTCVVTNTCGSATSNTAPVTVNTAPAITDHPGPQSACTGGSATFTVSATGSPAPTFQWRKNTANIPGATSSTLTLNPVGAGDAGSYDCVVTNACGSVASNAAALTLSGGPAFTTQPVNQTACPGGSATFTVAAGGSPAPTFQWRKNTVNIPGATGATYSINPVAAGDAGTYDCIATNSCGSTTSSAATLTTDAGPAITQQPEAQSACGDSGVTFTVAASASPAPTYQWRKNSIPLTDGGAISGATTPTLTINPAGPGDVGAYDVVITNSCGSTTSSPAALTTGDGPAVTQQPANQSVDAGEPAVFTVAASGDSPTYQWRKDAVPLTDGGAISGATTPTLTIDPALLASEGSYDAVVTNDCGGTTSDSAQLDVTCRADWDGDGAIQPADVASFISDWFSSLQQGTLVGDFDGNGAVEPSDVGTFVSAWFTALNGGC